MRILALTCIVVSACAAHDRALTRRAELRAHRAASEASPVTPDVVSDSKAMNATLSPAAAAYRSEEILKDVPWGATIDEVIAKKGVPLSRKGNTLTFNDDVVGAQVPARYAFYAGHLAQTKTTFSGRPPTGLIERGMQMRYGPALAAESEEARRYSVFGADDGDTALVPERVITWRTKESIVRLAIGAGGRAEVISSSLKLGPLLLNVIFDDESKK